MDISEHFTHLSPFFFRWRGYLFLFLLPIIVLSFIGFAFPFDSHTFDLFWELGCFLVSLLGFFVRGFTVGSIPHGSGRGTRKRRAEILNTTGMYSIVRHPLYLGNYLMALGIFLFPRTWFLPIIGSLAFILHYERVIFSEEEYLKSKFGEVFRIWAEKVPIIIPQFRNYQPPKLSFNWKIALRREFYGLFGIISAFFVLDIIADSIVYGRITFDPFWGLIFVMGFLFFILMQILKKKTNLLRVNGR